MLEAQVEELAPRVGEALLELRNVQLAHFCDLHLLPPYPREEAGLYGQLLGGEAHGLPRELLVDAAHLEHHASRPHDGHPRPPAAPPAAPPRPRLTSTTPRPGLTTATYPSTEPLPLPMRVSAAFWVTGLWGKMLIQTFPPRLIFLVIAIRAASIWRLLIQAGSSACSPYSPNYTSVPPLAWPRILPLWGFLYLSFFGTSISLPPDRFWLLVVDAVVDPDLHTDLAHLRLGLPEPVIYVRVQGVQGHPPLAYGLLTAHLDTTETTAALDPGTLRPAPHGARKRPLHRPPERRPARELLRDGLRNERGIQLGPRDLAHVDLDLLLGEALELTPESVNLGAALADNDAGARRVDVHRDFALLGGLPDPHVGYAGARELLLDVLPNLEVLAEKLGKVLVRVPAALEVDLLAFALDAEAEALRMYFLAYTTPP